MAGGKKTARPGRVSRYIVVEPCPVTDPQKLARAEASWARHQAIKKAEAAVDELVPALVARLTQLAETLPAAERVVLAARLLNRLSATALEDLLDTLTRQARAAVEA